MLVRERKKEREREREFGECGGTSWMEKVTSSSCVLFPCCKGHTTHLLDLSHHHRPRGNCWCLIKFTQCNIMQSATHCLLLLIAVTVASPSSSFSSFSSCSSSSSPASHSVKQSVSKVLHLLCVLSSN